MKKFVFLVISATLLISCQESLEERAAREARELTEKKCPMPIGTEGNLFLDSIAFDVNTYTLHQYYSLLLDTLMTLPNPEQGRQGLIKELNATPNYQAYRERGFNFHYLYRIKKDPSFIYYETTLTKEDYQ